MKYTLGLILKFSTIPSKKQVVKIRRIVADFDSDGGENHTCSRLHKTLIALVGCMCFILGCSSDCLYIFGLQK